MIQSEDIKTEYELQYNKIYIPVDYYNSNNKYTINGDELTIITNNNCTTSYNTTQCDCYRYNIKYNIITNSYQCNRNPSNYIISNESITYDSNYSTRITNEYKNNYTILFLIVITIILFATMFKRNSRNI